MVSIARPIVYTLASCPTCMDLKREFKRTSVLYEERDVGTRQQWLDEATGYSDSVPIVVYPDGRVELGFAGEAG